MRILFRLSMLMLAMVVSLPFAGRCTRSNAAEANVLEGTSSRASQDDATRRIPFHALNSTARSKLQSVLDNPSYFRRMPSQTIECDPELFVFLVRYPEVLVNLWDLMGVTKVNVNRTAPFVFKGSDGAGTDCEAELIYGTERLHIYYGDGGYRGGLINRELKGHCVCVLHSEPTVGPNGTPMVTGQMDMFLKLDNLGADMVARTISPFVGKTADYNFVETAKFIEQLSQVAHDNPTAVQQLAERMNNLQPQVRNELVQLTKANTATNPLDRNQPMRGGGTPRAAGFETPNRLFQRAPASRESAVMPVKPEVILRR